MDLVLDTGASQSILPWGFVQANRLRVTNRNTDDIMRDANGRLTQMARLSVPVQFEGEPTAGALEFLVNPADAGVEGILAPQDLVRSGGALIIDLGHEELRYEPEEAALQRLAADASSPLREVDFHGCLAEGLFNRSHRIVSATVNGVSSNMLIDTGASLTALTRNNPAIPNMLSSKGTRETAGGVSSRGAAFVVNDVPVVFSQTSFKMPVIVLPASQQCFEGALGADVLRHCTLVWGYSSLWAACRAP